MELVILAIGDKT